MYKVKEIALKKVYMDNNVDHINDDSDSKTHS